MRKALALRITTAFLAVILLVYCFLIAYQQIHRSKIAGRLANLEANIETTLSQGETRQFLTYLRSDVRRYGSYLKASEIQSLQALNHLLEAHLFFLIDRDLGPCIRIDSDTRRFLSILPSIGDVLTSPKRITYFRDKLYFENLIRTAKASAGTVDNYKRFMEEPVPDSHPNYYSPDEAIKINSQQIQVLAEDLRKRLQKIKLTP